jgi:hypothetical protein
MSGIYDIFFSYRRHDLSRAKPLLDALESAGLRIWLDKSAIEEGVSITNEIRQGIASNPSGLSGVLQSPIGAARESRTYRQSTLWQSEVKFILI